MRRRARTLARATARDLPSLAQLSKTTGCVWGLTRDDIAGEGSDRVHRCHVRLGRRGRDPGAHRRALRCWRQPRLHSAGEPRRQLRRARLGNPGGPQAMNDFTGKRVLVTGSAGVAGRAVASAFQAAGATVTGVDIVDDEAPWRTIVADLIDPEGAASAVAQAGVIDVLANIAGGFTMGDDIVGTTDDTWDFMMNLNARTALNMCRAARAGYGPLTAQARSSTSAHAGRCAAPRRWGPISRPKSVVIRVTETLSDELKRKGINVNCILPSIIDTPRNRADMPRAKFAEWVSPEAICRRRFVPGIAGRRRHSWRLDSGGRAVLGGLGHRRLLGACSDDVIHEAGDARLPGISGVRWLPEKPRRGQLVAEPQDRGGRILRRSLSDHCV